MAFKSIKTISALIILFSSIVTEVNANNLDQKKCFFGNWVSKYFNSECLSPKDNIDNNLYLKFLKTEEVKNAKGCHGPSSFLCNPILYDDPTCIEIGPIESLDLRCSAMATENPIIQSNDESSDYRNLKLEMYHQMDFALESLCDETKSKKVSEASSQVSSQECDKLSQKIESFFNDRQVEDIKKITNELKDINNIQSNYCIASSDIRNLYLRDAKRKCSKPFEGADEETQKAFNEMTYPFQNDLKDWLTSEKRNVVPLDLKNKRSLIRNYLNSYDYNTCLPEGKRDYSRYCALTQLENISLRASKDKNTEYLILGPAVNGMELAINTSNFKKSIKSKARTKSKDSSLNWYVVKESFTPFENSASWLDTGLSYSTIGTYNSSKGLLSLQAPSLSESQYEYYGRDIKSTNLEYDTDVTVPPENIDSAFSNDGACDDFIGNPYKAFWAGNKSLKGSYDPNKDKELSAKVNSLAMDEGLTIGAYNIQDAGYAIVEGAVGLTNLLGNAQTPDPGGTEQCKDPALNGQMCTRMWTLMKGLIDDFEESVIKKCYLETCELPADKYSQCRFQTTLNPLLMTKYNYCVDKILLKKLGHSIKEKLVKCASEVNEASRCFAQLGVAAATAAATGGMLNLTAEAGVIAGAGLQGLVNAGRVSPILAKWLGRIGNVAKGTTNFTIDAIVNQFPASPDDLLNLRNGVKKLLADKSLSVESREIAESILEKLDAKIVENGKFHSLDSFSEAKPGDVIVDTISGDKFDVTIAEDGVTLKFTKKSTTSDIKSDLVPEKIEVPQTKANTSQKIVVQGEDQGSYNLILNNGLEIQNGSIFSYKLSNGIPTIVQVKSIDIAKQLVQIENSVGHLKWVSFDDVQTVLSPSNIDAAPVGKLALVDSQTDTIKGTARIFKDAEGSEWIVKKVSSNIEHQMQAEIISSNLYKYFGIDVPDVHLVEIEGVKHLAYKPYDDTDTIKNLINPDLIFSKTQEKFKRMKYVAAYLQDVDRLANRSDVLVSDGDFQIRNFTESLGARAANGKKVGEVVSDTNTVFKGDSSLGEMIDDLKLEGLPDEHLWKEALTDDEKFQLLKMFNELTDNDIINIVKSAKYPNKVDEDFMINTLKQRRDSIRAGLKESLSSAIDREMIKYILPQSELRAIAAYTGNAFREINSYLRSGILSQRLKRLLDSDLPGIISSMESGLDKLPNYQGVIYRGTRMSKRALDEMIAKGEFFDKGFLSTSTRKETADQFLRMGDKHGRVDVKFQIISKTGKLIEKISNLSTESEVLFKPGVKFKILKVVKSSPDSSASYMIYLEEI